MSGFEMSETTFIPLVVKCRDMIRAFRIRLIRG